MKRTIVSVSALIAALLENPRYCVAIFQEGYFETISEPGLYFGPEGAKAAVQKDKQLVILKYSNSIGLPRLFRKWPFKLCVSHSLRVVATTQEHEGMAVVHWFDEDFGEKLEIMRENGKIFTLLETKPRGLKFGYEWNDARQVWQPVDFFKRESSPGVPKPLRCC